MKWLLDTNIASDSVRERPSRAVIDWMEETAQEDAAISAVTFAELRDGATTARDEARRRRLIEWVDVEVAQRFRDRTLPVTTDILIDWLRLGRRLSTKRITRDAADMLIACTARVHRLILVTRNVRDFADTGIVVYDPWSGKTHRMEQP